MLLNKFEQTRNKEIACIRTIADKASSTANNFQIGRRPVGQKWRKTVP